MLLLCSWYLSLGKGQSVYKRIYAFFVALMISSENKLAGEEGLVKQQVGKYRTKRGERRERPATNSRGVRVCDDLVDRFNWLSKVGESTN